MFMFNHFKWTILKFKVTLRQEQYKMPFCGEWKKKTKQKVAWTSSFFVRLFSEIHSSKTDGSLRNCIGHQIVCLVFVSCLKSVGLYELNLVSVNWSDRFHDVLIFFTVYVCVICRQASKCETISQQQKTKELCNSRISINFLLFRRHHKFIKSEALTSFRTKRESLVLTKQRNIACKTKAKAETEIKWTVTAVKYGSRQKDVDL